MRFVVKQKLGAVAGALDRIATIDGVEIIDRIGDAAALVETSVAGAERLKGSMPGWTIAPEAAAPLPSPPQPRDKWKLDS